MIPSRFSIRNLTQKMNAPKAKSICKYLTKVSQLIKPHTPDGFAYTDSYLYCGKLKQRIIKKHCINCMKYEKTN